MTENDFEKMLVHSCESHSKDDDLYIWSFDKFKIVRQCLIGMLSAKFNTYTFFLKTDNIYGYGLSIDIENRRFFVGPENFSTAKFLLYVKSTKLLEGLLDDQT